MRSLKTSRKEFAKAMKISSSTLNLMRYSAGAVMAAAAISGEGRAQSTDPGPISSDSVSMTRLANAGSQREVRAAEETKKEEGKKKEVERDPCPGCGMG
jgi:hypothetical protein